MDGIINGYKGKVWLCSHGGHALGLILREHVHDVYLNRLLLFRHAVDISEISADKNMIVFPPSVVKKALIEGTAEDIECELCENIRTWEMDKKLVVYLLGPIYGEKVQDAS